MYKLLPCIQNYDWGKLGESSLVYNIAKTSTLNDLDKAKHFAELWMGVHPNGTSQVLPITSPTNTHLDSHTKHKYNGTTRNEIEVVPIQVQSQTNQPTDRPKNCPQDNIPKPLTHHLRSPLPYLFKILSIGKPLSIQAHPDEQSAHKLHTSKPHIYGDNSAKPEMTVAVGSLKLMCGFRPINDIQKCVDNIPQLKKVLDAGRKELDSHTKQDNCGQTVTKPRLRCWLEELFACPMDINKNQLELLSSSGNCTQLFKQLHTHFPGDVGVWFAYFLNAYTLKDGEAIFIGPNILHSYIEGECVEIMANSDNVIRGGLTSKVKDVSTLIELLDYSQFSPNFVYPNYLDKQISNYKPPTHITLFQLYKISSTQIGQSLKFTPSIIGYSICLFLKSTPDFVFVCNSTKLHTHTGLILIIDPNTQITIYNENKKNLNRVQDEQFVLFIATCGDQFLHTQ